VFHYAGHLWTNPQLLEELIICSSTNYGCEGADGRVAFCMIESLLKLKAYDNLEVLLLELRSL
jgi:hypothetical protein